MNAINRINTINQKELADNVSDASSWHMDYKDTNYVFIGGLNSKLKDKDILIIFSQFGIPTHIKLIKEEDEKGEMKNKGFGYLKYEDFRSCVLAIDNMNGVVVYDKKIRVDHCWFELRDGEREEDYLVDYGVLVPEQKRIEGGEGRGSAIGQDVRGTGELEGKERRDRKEREATETLEKQQTEDDEFADPMASFIKKRHVDRHGDRRGDRKHRKRRHEERDHEHKREHKHHKEDKEHEEGKDKENK